MVNFDHCLKDLSRPVLIETIYLAGRFLSHQLTWNGFQRQLQADVKTPHRDQSVGAVLDLVREIERTEGIDIASLPTGRRTAYLTELDKPLWGKVTVPINGAEIENELTALRAEL